MNDFLCDSLKRALSNGSKIDISLINNYASLKAKGRTLCPQSKYRIQCHANRFFSVNLTPQQDPAVQQAARSAQPSNILEEYNPFDDENRGTRNATAQPPVNQAQSALPQASLPAYNQSSQINNAYGTAAPQISTEELQRRQEELERKAQELERREEQLRNGAAGVRRNNWPPLPEQYVLTLLKQFCEYVSIRVQYFTVLSNNNLNRFSLIFRCCFQPCFYQDINIEIQPEFQRIVRHLYYMWGLYAISLTSNAMVALLLLIFRGGDYSFQHFLFALIYGALFTPASFLCW